MHRDEICLVIDDNIILLKVDVISNNGKDIRTILYDGGVELLEYIGSKVPANNFYNFIDDFNEVYQYCQEIPNYKKDVYVFNFDSIVKTVIYTLRIVFSEFINKYSFLGLRIIRGEDNGNESEQN